MAILVVSCDDYSDLWNDFFKLMYKFWDTHDYPVYLVNNVMNAKFDNVLTINTCEEDQWSTRTRKALESINEKYICLLLEDFFIGDTVDNKAITDIVEQMYTEGLLYYKLNSFSRIRTQLYNSSTYQRTIPNDLDYGISLQAAIWEKNFLLQLIGQEDYNAWRFEINLLENSTCLTDEIISKCIYDDRNILNIVHGVVQGKFLPTAIRHFLKLGIHINTNSRPIMTKKEYFFYISKLSSKSFVPKFLRKLIKNIASRIGYKFVVK